MTEPHPLKYKPVTKEDIDILASGCLQPYSNAKYKYEVCTNCYCNSSHWNCLFQRMEWVKYLLEKKITKESKVEIKNLKSKLGDYKHNSAKDILMCLRILLTSPSRLYVLYPPHSCGDGLGDIYLTKKEANRRLIIDKKILGCWCKDLCQQLEVITLEEYKRRKPKNKRLSRRFIDE